MSRVYLSGRLRRCGERYLASQVRRARRRLPGRLTFAVKLERENLEDANLLPLPLPWRKAAQFC